MNNIDKFKVGDIIKVSQQVKEGKKERTISFKGLVVRVKGSQENLTFTVRQNLEGIDVDRIFPLISPTINKIELVETPKKRVRRASLLRIPTK